METAEAWAQAECDPDMALRTLDTKAQGFPERCGTAPRAWHAWMHFSPSRARDGCVDLFITHDPTTTQTNTQNSYGLTFRWAPAGAMPAYYAHSVPQPMQAPAPGPPPPQQVYYVPAPGTPPQPGQVCSCEGDRGLSLGVNRRLSRLTERKHHTLHRP